MSKKQYQPKYKFSHYAGRTTLNNIQVSVYIVDDETYQLRVEHAISGGMLGYPKTISVSDYEDLDFDPYNSLVRFREALEYCECYIDEFGEIKGMGIGF